MTTDNKPLIQFGWLRAAIYAAVSVVLLVIILSVIGVVITKNGSKDVIENGEQSISSFLSTYVIVSVVFIGLAFLFRKLVDRQSFFSLGFQWKGFSSQAISAFFLALLILCTGSMILVVLKFLFFTGVAIDTSNLFYSLLLFIIVAFTEEITFRGYILNNLMQSMNKWWALTICSIVFALSHITNPSGDQILPMLNIFVAGYLLGINYIYTKNLWFAIFLHFTWNFFQGPILGYEVSGFSTSGLFLQTTKGPALLTGGDFGFEGSLVCLILNIITCIFLWRYYESQKPSQTAVSN
jgi:uncharacterized protein